MLCLRAKQLVISLLKEFKLPLFSSLFGISRKTIVSQVTFLAIFRITMRGRKGRVDGPTSQARLQLLSAGWPAVGCLKSQRQSLICNTDVTATALQCVVKTRTDGMMGMKAHRMCSLKYARNLGFDFMKQPSDQLGKLDENGVSVWKGGMKIKI